MESWQMSSRPFEIPTTQPVAVLIGAPRISPCGHENPVDAAFCGDCGTVLQSTPSCPTCGRQNPPNLKFCHGCGTRVTAASPSVSSSLPGLAVPTTLAAGRYQIRHLLGEGAKKRVYLAYDALLDREVALALFKAQGLDETGRTSIRREAHALGQLGNHSHIVTLYDVGEENSQPYFVSQYLPGGSLQELLKNATPHHVSIEHALRLADQICQALAHAHQHGIIHRDLKPSNVWLTQDGSVKLGDFGLAASLDHSRFTLEGVLIGTAAYLPPEQLQGHKLDARSDLYSLGVMLYEMVAGRPPFVGDGLVSLIAQHLNSTPVAPSWHNPEIPPALDALILQLLAKTPEGRPESATAVRDAIQAITPAFTLPSDSLPSSPANSLDRLAGDVFVGRERELDELRDHLEEALAGHGRTVTLVGEPGIGKTRTATELATYARLRGALVLIGHCHEGSGAPPFWPWLQIVRTYLAGRDAHVLQTEMGAGAADIAQVVNEVRERLPDVPTGSSLEPEQARFRFFDSLTSFLKNAAKTQPLVLILDDLQWADTPSLLLLRFIAREVGESRLLIVVTCRDGEPGHHLPLSHTLAAVARVPGSQTLQLQGLSDHDVTRFIELTTGQSAAEAIVSAVCKETEGNPFFVTEIVRLLATEYDQSTIHNLQSTLALTIPQSVRSVIERRLTHLSEECRALLTVASVIGREFNLDILRRVAGASARPAPTEHQILELLAEAAAARLLTPVPHSIGRYSFSHALIRETLYEALPLSQCVRVHEYIGETLEDLYGIYPDPHLAELAHRFFLAAQGGSNRDKAIDYARRAGERAMTLMAYEEAAGHYERALQVLELQGTEEEQRCELLLALGEAWRKAGDFLHAREAFQRAADSARALKGRLEEPHVASLLARAALGVATGFAGVTVTAGTVDSFVVGLLEEALHSFAEEDSELKARVLGRLAMELYWSGATERRTELCRQAVAMARRIGDAAALAYTLNAKRIALWGPEKIEERLRDAAEVVQLAEKIGDREMVLRGQSGHITDLIELGDFQAADHELASYAQQAADLRQPFYLWLLTAWKAMRVGLEGRFTEAEGLARRALVIGQKAHDSDAVQYFTAQIIAFRGGRGLQETETPAKGFVEQYVSIPAWRCGLALIYVDTNRKTDARREFEYFAAHDFVNLPRDREWLGALASLSQVCAFLGDAPRAATLYQLLLPYAERYIVIGPAIVCLGSVARLLGLLAMTMGRWDDAQAHFEAALQGNTRIGARPLVAWTQLMYARMLVARAQAGALPTGIGQDVEHAQHVLAQALTSTQELGMDDLEQRVRMLQSQVSSSKFQVQSQTEIRDWRLEVSLLSPQVSSLKPQVPSTPNSELRTPNSHVPTQHSSVFRHEGEYWTVAFQGVVCRLKDANGLHYLAHLLHNPNQECHVLDVVTAEAADAAPPDRNASGLVQCGLQSPGFSDAGAVLDPQARAAYKRRLEDLREELEEAEEFNDPQRADRLQQEIEFLTQELATAVGLGGRNREAASHAERARVNVARAIKAVIKKTAEQHPALERYLTTTIKTGTFCSYTPDPRFPVAWQF